MCVSGWIGIRSAPQRLNPQDIVCCLEVFIEQPAYRNVSKIPCLWFIPTLLFLKRKRFFWCASTMHVTCLHSSQKQNSINCCTPLFLCQFVMFLSIVVAFSFRFSTGIIISCFFTVLRFGCLLVPPGCFRFWTSLDLCLSQCTILFVSLNNYIWSPPTLPPMSPFGLCLVYLAQ